MKARDAGKYIGVGRTKLKALIASGAFPGAYKNGRDHIVPVADLDAFVDEQAAAARAARLKAPAFRTGVKSRAAAPSIAPSVGAATQMFGTLVIPAFMR